MVGRAELLVEAARLHLEAELAVGRFGRIDAVDHDHDMVEPSCTARFMPASAAPC